MDHPKSKVSVTLDPELLGAVDRAVKERGGGSRSAVIEDWLRRAARMQVEDRLRAETVAYYESLSASDLRENTAIANAAARAARRLRMDD
ncbi:MAG TPA: ribbon-helix-helix domain-containing protein [Polyangiaceae bacterium]|jgi:metal-responsive CopG/Arc/MetJ family transcriptional regulator